jgi:hypothetical protein
MNVKKLKQKAILPLRHEAAKKNKPDGKKTLRLSFFMAMFFNQIPMFPSIVSFFEYVVTPLSMNND